MRVSTPDTTKSTASESIGQRIEDVRTFAGQTITLSFFAKSGSGTPNISVELNQSFGAFSTSPEVNTYVNKIALSTSWTRYTATITVPSISGKNIPPTYGIAETSYLEFRIWCSAGSNFNARTNSLGNQNNTFDIWGVQIEAGSVATPFRRNSNNIQGELAACQRYFTLIFADGNSNSTAPITGFGSGFSSTIVRAPVYLPVTMRTIPSMSFFGNFRVFDGVNTIAGAVLSVVSGSSQRNQVLLAANVNSGVTQFRPYCIIPSLGQAIIFANSEL
jgi:hypothetical protein